MAGSASDVSLSSNAMILLGGSTIASFTEQSAESEIAANLFDHSYKAILTEHRWRFATRQATLARLSAKPNDIYEYQFQLPTDLLYLIRAVTVQDYEIFEDKLYTNHTEVHIEYIYNISSDKVPSYWTKMFEYYLASQFAIPLTGDVEKASYYGQQYEKAKVKAKFADSSQRPARAFTYNRYADARRTGGHR